MKTFTLLLSTFLVLFTSSCKSPKKAEFTIENRISNAVLLNVQWGELPVTSQLLAGETSRKITLYENSYYYDLPQNQPVKFYLKVNNDVIYVETQQSYALNYGDNLAIVLSDTTKVKNSVVSSKK